MIGKARLVNIKHDDIELDRMILYYGVVAKITSIDTSKAGTPIYSIKSSDGEISNATNTDIDEIVVEREGKQHRLVPDYLHWKLVLRQNCIGNKVVFELTEDKKFSMIFEKES